MVPLAGALASVGLGGALVTAGCTEPRSPTVGQRFEDHFERSELGPDWRETGEGWRIEGGALRGQGARNHPLWLKRKLPRNARIEFDAVQAAYTATSYVVIFGGWGNNYNVIARMDEHAPDRRQRVGPRVEMGRHYHFTIERRGRVLRWLLDGAPMLEWDDPDPLAGPGHEYFAFNDWDALVHFDNLVITPL